MTIPTEETARRQNAHRRGEAVEQVANDLVEDLVAEQLLPAQHRDDARVLVFMRLAPHLFPGQSIEIPRLRRTPDDAA